MSKKIDDGMTARQRYDKKRKMFGVNISIEDYNAIAERAAKQNMTPPEWLRQAIADRIQWENENT